MKVSRAKRLPSMRAAAKAALAANRVAGFPGLQTAAGNKVQQRSERAVKNTTLSVQLMASPAVALPANVRYALPMFEMRNRHFLHIKGLRCIVKADSI